MSGIPLGLGEYQRDQLPELTLKNYFYEQDPTNLEDQVALIPRPRLKLFGSAGSGPIRGLFRKGNVLANVSHSGVIICLSGTSLYRVNQNDGTPTLIGTGITGDLIMTAEGNEDVVVLCAGAAPYWTDGDTVTEIALPAGFSAWGVDVLNGYFLYSSDLGRFYWSQPGTTTVSALDYATAESQPDVLYTLKVIGDELWLFGRYSIEVWQPTGDPDLPFQRIGGRIFGIGVTGRQSVQKLNVEGVDTICWVGTDRKVYRTHPNPVRISDHALEARLKRVVDPSAIYAVADNWHGHETYVLHIPGEGTHAYDLSTGQWSERTSYGRDLFRGGSSCVGPNNQPIFGDDTTNQLWEFSEDAITDGDDPVLFEFSGLLEVNGGPKRCANVSLDLAPGRSNDPLNDPTISMAWSDDMADTWSDEHVKPLGRQGQRSVRALWTRLPQLNRPGRAFRWRTTEPVTVRKAKLNEALR